jgi:adenine-specific DNA methylase
VLKVFNPHALIKFWARKETDLIFNEVKGNKLIADPFCGSGSSGFSAVFAGASAFLSDVNPVSVFIAYNILNGESLKAEIVEDMKELCYDIEDEVYTLNGDKVNLVVWRDVYKCPSCGRAFRLMKGNRMLCQNCNKTFFYKGY